VFGVGNYREKFVYLLHAEYFGKLVFFAWIKLRGHNERGRHYMFVKETAGLGHLVAFFSSHAIHFNDVVDVINDVFAGERRRQHVIIMGKNKTHLLCVIADGAWAVMFCRKNIEQLMKGIPGF
jgi:hypothetical protein